MILLWSSSCNFIRIMCTGVYKINKGFEKIWEVLWMTIEFPPSAMKQSCNKKLVNRKLETPRSMWWPWICMKRDIGQGRNLERQKIESKTGEDRLNWSLPQKNFSSARGICFVSDYKLGVRGTFSMVLNTYDLCNLKNNATCCASNSILMAGGLGWVVDRPCSLIGIIRSHVRRLRKTIVRF